MTLVEGQISGNEAIPRLAGTALVVGPLPPPYMGPAVGTVMVRAAFEAGGARTVHLNTQDVRSSNDFVEQVGRFDLRNVRLALEHAARMAWTLMRTSADVVYIPISTNRLGYLRDAVLMGITRLFRRKLVVHLRGAEMQDFAATCNPAELRMLRWSMGWATMAIALTPRLRSQYDGLVDPERVVVLENAIPDPWPDGVADLDEARAARLEGSPRALRVLFISNQIEAKGGLTLIRALAEPGLEELQLRIMGAPAGDDLAATDALARELGVADRIVMLGSMGGDDKRRELEGADVLAHPSGRDAQPIVLLEGMAAGLPLIGSTIGGVEETVGDCGPIVEPGDAAAVAEALRTFVDDPGHRLELGARGRRRFEERYSVRPYEERFRKVFAALYR